EGGTGDAPARPFGLEFLKQVVPPEDLRLAPRRVRLQAQEHARGPDRVDPAVMHGRRGARPGAVVELPVLDLVAVNPELLAVPVHLVDAELLQQQRPVVPAQAADAQKYQTEDKGPDSASRSTPTRDSNGARAGDEQPQCAKRHKAPDEGGGWIHNCSPREA